jgi:molybdopterin/thiamine biosynthesis adenylyltransferase
MKHAKRRKREKGQTRTSAASAASAAPARPARPAEAAEAQAGRVGHRKWWDRWPGRLEFELEQLEAAGIPFERDEEAFAAGSVVLRMWPTVGGERVFLIARFPDFYPYVRFEVEAPELDLDHHQAPFRRNLCLIGGDTKNWHTRDTLAGFINGQLPLVLKTGRSGDRAEVDGLEEPQGEPFSVYYTAYQDSTLLIDGGWSIDNTVAAGELVIGVKEDAGEILRGAVLDVKDADGRTLGQLDPALARLYPKTLRCRWVRLDEPIREEDAGIFFGKLFSLHPSLSNPWWKHIVGGRMDVIGVLFPEEVGWRKKGDGWVFGVRLQLRGSKGYGRGDNVYLARAARAGRSDLAARVPELRALRDSKIAVAGLGGLGSPSALEFARAGAKQLRILDRDIVEPGTTVRWALGIPASGVRKADALKEFIDTNYPYTEVVPYVHQIGNVLSDGPSDLEVLDSFLEGVDLVYDATAEVGIQHLLSALAAERGIPYVCVSTTRGAWGGLVARIRPRQTAGCWVCLQYRLEDESIPPPPADPEGGTQPAGCASPTFTGTGFDVSEIALAGVRLAVSTISAGDTGAYPDVDWDVAVVSLREGRLIAPRWDTFPLNQHPSCSCITKSV